jgi:phosphoglycolate phosphatase
MMNLKIDLSKYTHIVWDFNGTILDDVGIGIDSVNVLLKKRGLPVIESLEKYHSVFGFPIVDYYRRLGFDFEKEPYSEIAIEWVNEYNSRRCSAPLCTAARELLQAFQDGQKTQLIISATEYNMLSAQLDELGIKGYFSELLGLDNIHAGSKIHLAENWRKNNPDAKALFIGDTDHDLETASAMKADCVLVAMGHQSYEHLARCSCPVVKSLAEILSVL